MKEKEIEKFYEKYCVKKPEKMVGEFPRIWENPPIPEGKKLVFEVF